MWTFLVRGTCFPACQPGVSAKLSWTHTHNGGSIKHTVIRGLCPWLRSVHVFCRSDEYCRRERLFMYLLIRTVHVLFCSCFKLYVNCVLRSWGVRNLQKTLLSVGLFQIGEW